MAVHNNLGELFTNTANAIRSKTGGTEPIIADNFPTEIENIQTGSNVDWTQVTAKPSQIWEGKMFYNCVGELTAGTYIEADYDYGTVYPTDPYSFAIEGLIREPRAFMIISQMDSMGYYVGGDYNVILGIFGYGGTIRNVSGAGMYESTSLQSAYVLWNNNGASTYHNISYSWDEASGTLTFTSDGGDTDANICVPLYFGVEGNDEKGAYRYLVYFDSI